MSRKRTRAPYASTHRHRWVLEEPHIPFELDVLYEDENIIVVDKPHFLATTPRGMWYRQTALIRLREQFGEPDITPAHRLDRATAGIVVFVRNKERRGAYQTLFERRKIAKQYECLAPLAPVRRPHYGTMRKLQPPYPFPLERSSHITKERGVLQAYEEPGIVNAQTLIERAELHTIRGKQYARYLLTPHTGKTHQLRVHMSSLGLPILGDDFYPNMVRRDVLDFSNPLQLIARSLEFDDPVSAQHRYFVSRIALG